MENPIVVDDNPNIKDNDRLPIRDTLTVIKYRTIKKNNALGWWSAIVLLEDHAKKQVCFYRWRRTKGEWKRDKKLPFKTRADWASIKDGVEAYINELE